MKLFCFLTMLVLTPRMLPAQSPTPAPATGTVAGHVFLGDSHLPARMATVLLIPVSLADVGRTQPDAGGMGQSGLDGSFVLPNVPPGAYYLVGSKRGYVCPVYLEAFSEDDVRKDVQDAVAAAHLTPIVVAANRTATTDIVLDRGAAISGAIRFDDGEPDSGATVSLLRKDKSGKWAGFANEASDGGASTDDQGNFRLSGLPAGEYLLRTTLELQGSLVANSGNDVSGDPTYRWDIYFGDGVRPRDAKAITLKDGEESSGDNITIPLSRLHSVSGTILSLETGLPLGSARVELHNSDDDSLDAEIRITSGGQFRLPYVAEGEYILKVRGASDPAPGSHQSDDEKPTRTYADASQPLMVKGETSGITIQLKPQPAVAVTTPTTAQ